MNIKDFDTRLRVAQSPKFEEILHTWEENQSLPATVFHKNYLSKIDPEITYLHWQRFLRGLNKKKKMLMMETITEAVGSEIEVYANIRKQAFGLGNTVISEAADEIAELIQKGKRIPDDKKKMVMQWFFKQKELDQAERVIELKEQGNEREERLVDNILKESMFARAITLDEVEAVEADFEEEIKDEREIENLPRPSSLQESATNEEKGSLATSEG